MSDEVVYVAIMGDYGEPGVSAIQPVRETAKQYIYLATYKSGYTVELRIKKADTYRTEAEAWRAVAEHQRKHWAHFAALTEEHRKRLAIADTALARCEAEAQR